MGKKEYIDMILNALSVAPIGYAKMDTKPTVNKNLDVMIVIELLLKIQKEFI